MRGRGSGGIGVLPAVSCALFVDSLLYSIVVPVVPTYAQGLGVSSAAIGVLFAAYAIGLLLTTPVFGVVADRVGRRIPIVLGSLGVAASTVLFAYATSYPLLLEARVLQGISAAAVWTAGIALISDHTPASRLGTAMGTAMAAMSIGLIAGPPLGGLLVSSVGHRAPFLAAAAAAVINAAVQWMCARDAPGPRHPGGGPRVLLRDRRLWLVATAVVVTAGALSMLEPLLPLLLAHRYAAGATLIGLLFGAATLTNGLSSVVAGAVADRRPLGLLLSGGLLGMAGTLALLALPLPLAALTAVVTGFAVAFSFVLVPALPEFARIAERHGGAGYATAYAAFNLAYGAGMALGPVAGGYVAGRLSIPAALVLAGAAMAAAAATVAVRTRPVRHPALCSPAGGHQATD